MWLLISALALANHDPRCDDHDVLIDKLRTNFAEEVVAVAVTKRGALVEMLTSEKSGSWTILITYPSLQGQTCMLEAGDGFELLQPGERS